MVKLKTLKDIGKNRMVHFGFKWEEMGITKKQSEVINEQCHFVLAGLTKDMVFKESLKQAAIEWIKHLEENQKEPVQTEDIFIAMKNTDIIKWIKHFFNLSEEDLKDG